MPDYAEGKELLQCRLLLEPIIEVWLRHHFQVRLHVVVPEATKLRTDNFVLADLRCREMHRNIQSGDKILLHSQLPDKERMANISGMHEQMNFLIHRDRHLGGHDIVFGILVVRGVETKEILRRVH